MSQKAKNITLFIILLVVIYMTYKIIKNIKPGNTTESNNVFSKKSSNNKTSCSLYGDNSQPILYLQNNDRVKTAQCRLNHYHDAGLVVDGVFGDATMSALQRNGYNLPLYVMDIKDWTVTS